MHFLARPVLAPWSDTPLTLVTSRGRPGREPWRLLTNRPVTTLDQAWEVVQISARRWGVEMTIRWHTSEWGLESCRLRRWAKRAKLWAVASLVYGFVVWLLTTAPDLVRRVLRAGCHRTGQQPRQTPCPWYRLRAALATLWPTPPMERFLPHARGAGGRPASPVTSLAWWLAWVGSLIAFLAWRL